MKKNSDFTVQRIINISQKTWIFSVMCFVLSGVVSLPIIYLQLNWTWLEVIGKILLGSAFLGFGTFGIAQAVFIVAGAPHLAYAWHCGASFVVQPDKSWEQLSMGAKILFLLWSAFLAIATIVVAINFDYS